MFKESISSIVGVRNVCHKVDICAAYGGKHKLAIGYDGPHKLTMDIIYVEDGEIKSEPYEFEFVDENMTLGPIVDPAHQEETMVIHNAPDIHMVDRDDRETWTNAAYGSPPDGMYVRFIVDGTAHIGHYQGDIYYANDHHGGFHPHRVEKWTERIEK